MIDGQKVLKDNYFTGTPFLLIDGILKYLSYYYDPEISPTFVTILVIND